MCRKGGEDRKYWEEVRKVENKNGSRKERRKENAETPKGGLVGS